MPAESGRMVYAAPAAYHAFLKTGQWPDGTMLVMEIYSSGSEGSINQGGQYQLASMGGVEAHVKDSSRTGDLWKQLERSGGLAIQVGGEFPGLELELWALRS